MATAAPKKELASCVRKEQAEGECVTAETGDESNVLARQRSGTGDERDCSPTGECKLDPRNIPMTSFSGAKVKRLDELGLRCPCPVVCHRVLDGGFGNVAPLAGATYPKMAPRAPPGNSVRRGSGSSCRTQAESGPLNSGDTEHSWGRRATARSGRTRGDTESPRHTRAFIRLAWGGVARDEGNTGAARVLT